MAWSDEFIDRLMTSSTQDFVWALRIVKVGSAPCAGTPTFTSVPMSGGTHVLGLAPVDVQGSTVSLASRSASVGAFTVGFTGDARQVFSQLTRGSWVQLLCGFANWPLGRFNPIALGRVQNLRGAPPSWVIECWDWKSALQSRNDPDDPNLFFNVSASTTTADAFAYTQNSTTAFDVAANADFGAETGGTGAIKVNDSFYLLYTAKPSGTRFTVGTVNKFGTSQASFTSATPSVDTVTECAYLSGHPSNIVRKLLTSTGDGTNGDYDTYPAGWGYAIPDALLDHNDISRWANDIVTVSSGSYTCELIVEEPKENGLSWIEGWLSPHGLILAMRQGQITVRAITGSILLESITGDPVSVITDDDISCYDRIDWEAWDSDYSLEYCWLTVTSWQHDGLEVPESSSSSVSATLPAIEELLLDVSESVWDNTQTEYIHANILDRLSSYVTRIPERITMTLPLRFAQLCVLDTVFLRTSRVYGREDDGFVDGRPALVVEVSPDWTRGTCRVAVALKPTSEEVWAA